MSRWHAMSSLAIALVLSMLMSTGVGCIHGWLGLGNPPVPIVVPPKWQTGWCHQCSEGSWLFALQFVVHLEIHQGSPSSSFPLGFWTNTEKVHNCYFDLSKLFPVQLGQQFNHVQRIFHVHHSQPELIMGDQVEYLHEVHRAQSGCWCACASCTSILRLVTCPLPCRNPACSSAISVSVFTRILSSMIRRRILLACETRAIVL